MSASTPGASASSTVVHSSYVDYKSLIEQILPSIEQRRASTDNLRKLVRELRVSYSHLFLEFYTLRISGPRQSGKSSSIVEMAEKGDLVVCYNLDLENLMRKHLADKGHERARAISARELKTWIDRAKKTIDPANTPRSEALTGLLPTTPRYVFVDDATFIEIKKLVSIKDIAWWCSLYPHPPTLILVG